MKNLKILICISDAEASKAAFHFGCASAKTIGASVTIVTIINSTDLQNPLVSGMAKAEETQRADALLAKYVHLAQEEDYGVTLSTMSRVGDFEENIITIVNSDGDIGMIVIGYSAEMNAKAHTATSLITKLANALVVPLVVIPSNLTDHQISELTSVDR